MAEKSYNTAAELRAAHAEGLKTELAYHERQPDPDKTTIAAIKADLERYTDKPARRQAEKAVAGPADAPAKKTAARRPRKQAAKKTAAAKPDEGSKGE